jgi:hypothetical protein
MILWVSRRAEWTQLSQASRDILPQLLSICLCLIINITGDKGPTGLYTSAWHSGGPLLFLTKSRNHVGSFWLFALAPGAIRLWNVAFGSRRHKMKAWKQACWEFHSEDLHDLNSQVLRFWWDGEELHTKYWWGNLSVDQEEGGKVITR